MHKQVHIFCWCLYIIAVSSFGYLIIAKHIPIVGWDYVINHWRTYVMVWVGGTCVWAMFYLFSLLINEIEESIDHR